MQIFYAIILGLIQGLTEFFPISSSGHLVIVEKILNFHFPGIVFEVMVHFGSLLAVLIIFRKDICEILKDSYQCLFLKRKKNNLIEKLIIATIPAVILGLFFKSKIELLFNSPQIIGIMLIITGLILFLSKFITYNTKNLSQITAKDAFIIGLAQSIAIIPGISRSGSTIVTGYYRKIKHTDSVKFSFLLSIIIIFGANFLEIKEMQLFLSKKEIWILLTGIFSAFIGGYFAITFLLKIIKSGKLHFFAYYCWIVGILSTILFNFFL